MIDTAVVLAAGFGSRMGDFTKETPKPLLFVWGKTLLDHLLTKLVAYEIKRLIVNTHYLADQIKAHVTLWKKHFPDLIISHEEEILGTGGTLQSVRPFVEDKPFFVINGDVLWQERSTPSLGYVDQVWDQHKKPVLALVHIDKAWGYRGVGDFFIDKHNNVEDKPNKRAIAPYVYGGIQVMDPYYLKDDFLHTLNLKTPFDIQPLWRKLIANQALKACIFPDPWFHIGDKEALKAAVYI